MDRTERQKLGIQRWIDAGCRASLVWSTGVGKTYGAILAIKAFLSKNSNKVIVVVVPTEHLKIQWMQELAKVGLFYDVSVEIINSAVKVNTKIDFIILDEAHRVPGNTFFEVFNKRNPTIILGLSATFNRLDGKHELLNKYCPPCDFITTKEAIENNWLSQYKEYKVIIEADDIDSYKEYSRQFQEAFSVFNFDFNVAMKCLTNIIYRRYYAKTLGITPKDIDAIVFTWNRMLKARKDYIMNHPKKIEITRKILAHRQDKKAITFSATIKQAEKIGGGLVVHSGNTKKKNRITMAEFASFKTGAVHTAKSLDEGVDIKGLNLAIVLCNNSSSTQKTQRVG